jgi:hypothetical protein
MTAKVPALRNLTPELCQKLQKEMLEACQKVADAHGLSVVDGGMQDMNLRTGFEFEVRIGIPLSDGSIYEPNKAMFEVMAENYALNPDDFGREFSTGNETFRITGIEPRRPKYPIKAERLPDRQGFKFSAENVAMFLKAAKAKT